MRLESITIVDRPHPDRRALMSRGVRDPDGGPVTDLPEDLVMAAAQSRGITLSLADVQTGFLRGAGERATYSPTHDGSGAFPATWCTY